MLSAIKVNLSRQEIIGAVKAMNKRDRRAKAGKMYAIFL